MSNQSADWLEEGRSFREPPLVVRLHTEELRREGLPAPLDQLERSPDGRSITHAVHKYIRDKVTADRSKEAQWLRLIEERPSSLRPAPEFTWSHDGVGDCSRADVRLADAFPMKIAVENRREEREKRRSPIEAEGAQEDQMREPVATERLHEVCGAACIHGGPSVGPDERSRTDCGD